MNNPKYSIVSPAFNELNHIDECISNITGQADELKISLEFIIIDDCSIDGTYEKIESHRDRRIKLYKTTENSGGAGAPRNLGLSMATGKYILFYDFGDAIDLSEIEKITDTMEEENICMAIMNHVDIHPNEQMSPSPIQVFKTTSYTTTFKELPELIHNPFCWGKIYNLDWIRKNKIRFGNQYCGEDKVFTWKSYMTAEKILIHPHILYGHRFFGPKINRMLQRDLRLIDAIISIDNDIYFEFKKNKFEHIYAKRLMQRDILGIILSDESIGQLKSTGALSHGLKKLKSWFDNIIPDRIEFSANLNLDQRKFLSRLLGGVFSDHLEREKEIYNSREYVEILCNKQDAKKTPNSDDNFIIALHLPQYHPDPNNDKNWGKGFTEWTNVSKAKPLYEGHQQPKLPSDLGFYDLRLHESRIEQMRLAKYHGVDAFCYYHYWFAGKTVLQKPLSLMLKNTEENFPFMLCWANETWTGIWHGSPNRILIEQTYPGESDYKEHFKYLLQFFNDSRYIKINNKPALAVWQPDEIPDTLTFLNTFESLAKENGFDGMHMIGMQHWHKDYKPLENGYQRSVPLFMPPRLKTSSDGPTIYNFEKIYDKFLPQSFNEFTYPCITPNWDNTPRSGTNGMVFENNNPGLFARQLKDALSWSKGKSTEKILFIKAWNEWAEGNYLEPDQIWGGSYLSTLKYIISSEEN